MGKKSALVKKGYFFYEVFLPPKIEPQPNQATDLNILVGSENKFNIRRLQSAKYRTEEIPQHR